MNNYFLDFYFVCLSSFQARTEIFSRDGASRLKSNHVYDYLLASLLYHGGIVCNIRIKILSYDFAIFLLICFFTLFFILSL